MAHEDRRLFIRQLLQYDFDEEDDDEDDEDEISGPRQSNHRYEDRDGGTNGQPGRGKSPSTCKGGRPKEGNWNHVRALNESPVEVESGIEIIALCRQHLLLSEPFRDDELDLHFSERGRPQSPVDTSSRDTYLNQSDFQLSASEQDVEGPNRQTVVDFIDDDAPLLKHERARQQQLHSETSREGSPPDDSATESLSRDVELCVGVRGLHSRAVSVGGDTNEAVVTNEISSQSFTDRDKGRCDAISQYVTEPKPTNENSSTDFSLSDSRGSTEPLAKAESSSTDSVSGGDECVQQAISADTSVNERRANLAQRSKGQREGSFQTSSQFSEDKKFLIPCVAMTTVENFVSMTEDVDGTELGTGQGTKKWIADTDTDVLRQTVENVESRHNGDRGEVGNQDPLTLSMKMYQTESLAGVGERVPEMNAYGSLAIMDFTSNIPAQRIPKMDLSTPTGEADQNFGVNVGSAFHRVESASSRPCLEGLGTLEGQKRSSSSGSENEHIPAEPVEPELMNVKTESPFEQVNAVPECVELDVETEVGLDPHLETSREELELGLAPPNEALEGQDFDDTQNSSETADTELGTMLQRLGDMDDGNGDKAGLTVTAITLGAQEHASAMDYDCNDEQEDNLRPFSGDGDATEFMSLSATRDMEAAQALKVVPLSNGPISSTKGLRQTELQAQIPVDEAPQKDVNIEDGLLMADGLRFINDGMAVDKDANVSYEIGSSRDGSFKEISFVDDVPTGRITRGKRLQEKVLAMTEQSVDRFSNQPETIESTSGKRKSKSPRPRGTKAPPRISFDPRSRSLGEGSAQDGNLSAKATKMFHGIRGPTLGPCGVVSSPTPFTDLLQSVAASESLLPQKADGDFSVLSPGLLLSQVMEIARQPNALIGMGTGDPTGNQPGSSKFTFSQSALMSKGPSRTSPRFQTSAAPFNMENVSTERVTRSNSTDANMRPSTKAGTSGPKSRKKKKSYVHHDKRTMVVATRETQHASGSPLKGPLAPMPLAPSQELSRYNAGNNVLTPSLYGFASTPQSAQNLMRMETDKQLFQAQSSAQDAMTAATTALAQSHIVWARVQSQVNQSPAHLAAIREAQIASVAATVAAAASVAKAAVEAARAIQEASNEALSQHSTYQENLYHTSLEGRARRSVGFTIGQGRVGMANPQPLQVASGHRIVNKGKNKRKATSVSRDAMVTTGGHMSTRKEGRTTMKGQEDVISSCRIQDAKKRISHRACETSETIVGVTKNQNKLKEPQTQDFQSQATHLNEETARENHLEEIIQTRKEMFENFMKLGEQSCIMDSNLSSPADQRLKIVEHRGGKNIKEASDAIQEGSVVEVMSEEEGLRGGWFSAKVLMMTDKEALVVYDELLTDDGHSQLKEWFPLSSLREEDAFGSSQPSIRRWMRPVHPFSSPGKRRRISSASQAWVVGDHVDAFIQDGWWEGVVQAMNEDDETRMTIYFPGEEDTAVVRKWNVRPSLIWSNNGWRPWKGSFVEEDGPPSKRQKLANITGKMKREEMKKLRYDSKAEDRPTKKISQEHKATPEPVAPRVTRQSLEAQKKDSRGIMVMYTGKVSPVQPAVPTSMRELRSGNRSSKSPVQAKPRPNLAPKKIIVSAPSRTSKALVQGHTPSTRAKRKAESDKRNCLRKFVTSKR